MLKNEHRVLVPPHGSTRPKKAALIIKSNLVTRTMLRVASVGIAVSALSLFSSRTVHAEDGKKAFNPKSFVSFPIKKITNLSPNTKAYDIALPEKDSEMGCGVASFIMVKNAAGDARPYTPTTLNDQKGSFELVVKAYPGGKVSEYLHSLKVGDSIEVKGPINKLKYEVGMKKKIAMIAGGTGITPMLQVIQEILKNPADKTQINLVFANNAEEDILLKARIDELAAKHKDQFKVTYVLSQPSASWKGEKGFVRREILEKCGFPHAGNDVLVLVCGPPPMMAAISGDKTKDYKQGMVEGLLKELHFTEDMVYKF